MSPGRVEPERVVFALLKPVYLVVAPGMNMSRCSACGSLVMTLDEPAHSQWHEAVVRLGNPDLTLIDQLAGK